MEDIMVLINCLLQEYKLDVWITKTCQEMISQHFFLIICVQVNVFHQYDEVCNKYNARSITYI